MGREHRSLECGAQLGKPVTSPGSQQVDSHAQAGRPAASEGEAQEESVGEAPMCQGLCLDHGARLAGAGPSLGPGRQPVPLSGRRPVLANPRPFGVELQLRSAEGPQPSLLLTSLLQLPCIRDPEDRWADPGAGGLWGPSLGWARADPASCWRVQPQDSPLPGPRGAVQEPACPGNGGGS